MNEDDRATLNQSVSTTQGSVAHDIIQAIVNGPVTGDVHIGNIMYTRSTLEELKDYLARAVADYQARMYEAVIGQPVVSSPYKFLDFFKIEDVSIYFGRDTAIEALFQLVVS